MKTIFDGCQPRADVLAGELRDQMFAAQLEDVVQGTADPIYQDPTTFFANTHPARGLQSLLEEALGRATGKRRTAAPIIRLETAFGGGKTHSLIALYHLARGARPIGLERYVDPELAPESPIPVAAIVGSALEPSQGIEHGDVTTYTIWGELAYQLGAYDAVRQADQDRMAPGTRALAKVLGDGPVIVLMDELARYLEVAQGLRVGKSTLADQTTAFLMSLLEAADSAARVVVVYTLATSSDAFAAQTETIQRAVAESKAVSARKEHVITPTQEDEIAVIVRHRLFEHVDLALAREIARAYHAALAEELERGSDLPANAAQAGYATDIENDYPFHPELLRALNEKVGTIPNFQRTRGALRLLARTVRRLWETRPTDAYLIHIHHIDLRDEETLNDLTSRLGRPEFRQVAEADIANPKAGARAHAQVADEELVKAGRPPYGSRIATTAFLHSLVQGAPSGVTPTEAKLAIFTPGDDLGLVEKQLDRLLESCWFLDLTGNRLRFSTEPSLVKIVADEVALVGKTSAKSEIDDRVRKIWRKGIFDTVFFPAEPSDVEDTFERAKLVVLHYDAVRAKADDEAPPDLVVHLADRAGTAQTFRRFRNNVVFLVADEDLVDNAVDRAQHYLAVNRIIADAARLAEFTEDQQRRLRRMAEEGELTLRVAITRMYRHLYYPDASAPEKHGRLGHAQLPAQDQAEVERDQCEVVLRVLRDLDRVITADSPDIAPKFVRDKAWPQNAERVTTLQLRQQFAMSPSLRMLLDVNKLKEAIKLGVRTGQWLYYDPRRGCAWSKESTTTPLIEISSDVELLLPEAAGGIPICDLPEGPEVAEETCPVCHRPVSQCICGVSTPKPPEPTLLSAQGAPGQAFQGLADQAKDRGIASLGWVSAEVTGAGAELLRDLTAMALAVPQLPKAKVTVDMFAALDLADGTHLQVRYRGPWDRYRPLHDVVQKVKPEELADASGKLQLTLAFPDGIATDGADLGGIRDVFVQLNPGAVTLRAEPLEAGA
jgi:hypothetical protein